MSITSKTRKSKRQRTAALQDADALNCTPLLPRGLGVRLSSAAFVADDYDHEKVLLLSFCVFFEPCMAKNAHE
jgi:hypothetical protein